ERAELHARAAPLVGDEAEALRHRAAAATEEDEALAADLAAFAAREAARGSWASAAAMFGKAARLAPDGPPREHFVVDAVECLLQSGDVLGARALAGPLETFTDAARSRYLLGQLAALSGRPDEAERLLTAAWEGCPENDRMLAAKIAEELARVTMACLRAEDAITWAERALAAAEGTPVAYRPLPYLSLAFACVGRVTEAVDAVAAVPEPGEANAELESFLLARTFARIYSGAIGEASDDAARLVTTACRSGHLFPHTVGLAMLSLTEYRIGAWDDAIMHAELGASLADDAEFRLSLSSLHAVATWPLAGRGEWDSAEGHVQAAADTANTLFTMAMAKSAEAAVAGARGQHQRVIDAVTCLRAMGAAVEEDDLWPWHELYVGALIGMDRLEEADAELERFEAVAAARSPSAMAKASRLRGTLEMARGRNEEAGAAFARALEQSSTVPAPFDRALAQASFGAFLRREGKLSAAVEQLKAAREGFVRLGARPFLESCDRELASCGPLPGGGRPMDPSGLTPKEMSVATLVTKGKTNREVASELFISVNTVEYHLKHIYAKLGINSRSQLIVRLGVGQEDLDGEPR
ncbi:MAG TPA: LuxR C-terminal-related transcriptional regulator, partial [Acidimicrobiales bacterium]|nr:LuxR C-terminal-related transcriptional regulator [Acidimicrobiales bacterium]